MYRTFVILRHTFLEAESSQPIYPLLLGIARDSHAIFGVLARSSTAGEWIPIIYEACPDVCCLLRW